MVVLLTGTLSAAVWADSTPHGLAGRVTTAAIPLAQAHVYAYQMSDLSLHRVSTDAVGSFLFSDLPAGLFKIIAIKAGFVPAVVLLTRDTNDIQQYLEVDLVPQTATQVDGKQSFWSIRQKLPTDVLRDLETLEMAAANRESERESTTGVLETRLAAMTGTNDAIAGAGEVSRGQLAVSGSLGASEFDLTGDYWLARAARSNDSAAHAAEFSLSLSNPNGSRVRLTTIDNRINSSARNYTDVDLSRYQVSWSQEIGRGSSQVSAEFVEQSNFYATGALQPVGVPLASRSWNVEGNYTTPIREQSSIQTGFRFRQRQGLEPGAPDSMPEQRIDLFGTAATRVASSVLVQYGLYSTLRDGSLSLVPRGGVVVDLSPTWTAKTTASHKVHEDQNDLLADFTPVAFSNNGECQGEDFCYRMELARNWANDQNLSISAMHRRFGETLRLYFNDDFFNHFESLYLVDGDTLPELQFAMTNRLSPQILTRLESSIAAGGGGLLRTTDSNIYENNVRYLVTSLDTRFERTDTGVFLAFHHLEQKLEPIMRGLQGTALEMQRLQLMLTQDLSALNLASLALRLNMELSRGGSLADSRQDADELYKSVMGGVAVTF